MSKVILQGYIEVLESSLDAVLLELPNHIALTLAEPGCLVFKVEQDEEFTNRFYVYEEFINKQAFAKHQLRVENSWWGSVTENASRHYKVENDKESD